jgi:hypothetical protein
MKGAGAAVGFEGLGVEPPRGGAEGVPPPEREARSCWTLRACSRRSSAGWDGRLRKEIDQKVSF